MTEFIIPIAIITFLILLNGLYVAAEFAIIGVRPTRIQQLAEQGNRTAADIRGILADPVRQDRYLATAQLGITIASLGLGMYGESTVAHWLLGPLEQTFHLNEAAAHSIAAVIAITLLTFAHVVVGEMVPKSLALQYAERTAFGIAGIMNFMRAIFRPAVLLLNAIGNALLQAFGIPPTSRQAGVYSPQELELIVSESHEGGLVSENEQQLIQNIFDFGERRVGQVMTPRPRIVAVPLDSDEKEVLTCLLKSPHSRLLVYEGDLDHVVGLLHIKDFVRQQLRQPGQFKLSALLRPIPAVPESALIERLLAAFKRSRVHMALVIDEYGGTAGIVTLEDLVEEIVGEVHDEFDAAQSPALQEIEPGVLLARGDLLLDELRDNTSIDLPADRDLPDIQTVGGLVTGLLGRLPQPGDQVSLNSVTFTVDSVEGRAVTAVRITLEAAVRDDPDDQRPGGAASAS
jgi:CBS domain containing-hemolysin-like protein